MGSGITTPAAPPCWLSGLIDAITDGLRAPGLQERLTKLTARQEALRTEVETIEARGKAPALHPKLGEVYRARVARLREGLAVADGREALARISHGK